MVPTKLDHRVWKDAWFGATVCILGSGPSLTKKSLATVQDLKEMYQLPVIAVNSSFIPAKWADIVFFSNRSWWNYYQLPVRRSFPGLTVSVVNAADPKVMVFRNQVFRTYQNSGADAIALALYMGAKRIILAGFDGPDARPAHWHEPHPAMIRPQAGAAHWTQAMQAVAKAAEQQYARLYSLAPTPGYAHIPALTVDQLRDSSFYPTFTSRAVPLHTAPRPAPPSAYQRFTPQPFGAPPAPRNLRLGTWSGRWNAKTVFVLASGPSLTPPDVEAVKSYTRKHDCPVVVTNTTFRMAPWAELLFFHDRKWWEVHGEEVNATFPGLRVTMASLTAPTILSLAGTGFNAYRNSGAGAISFAVMAGAKRVITLGLDGKYAADGRRHWHAQHPRLGDAATLPRFVKYFPQLARDAAAKGVEIINASRDTALTCFPRATLEDVLSSPPA